MSDPFRDFTPQAPVASAITPDDILVLRRSVWRDGQIDRNEAEAILALNDTITEPSVAWTDFFVEALSVWLVDQQDPRGTIDDDGVDWLVTRLDRDEPDTVSELELLARVLEKAAAAPERLRQFALAQAERAMTTGDPVPGPITASDSRVLRRLIFSPGRDHLPGVVAAEAEMLFRIMEAALTAENAPEWKQLFVQGIANYLQGTGGDLSCLCGRPASREWEAEFERSAAIDPEEQSWIDAQVHADGKLDEYEQALLDFLRQM